MNKKLKLLAIFLLGVALGMGILGVLLWKEISINSRNGMKKERLVMGPFIISEELICDTLFCQCPTNLQSQGTDSWFLVSKTWLVFGKENCFDGGRISTDIATMDALFLMISDFENASDVKIQYLSVLNKSGIAEAQKFVQGLKKKRFTHNHPNTPTTQPNDE